MEPKTLQEAIVYFDSPVNCREYMVARRWPDGVTCPRCGSKNVLFLEKYNRWHCREKHAAPQFTLKTGTIYEDSPISLSKWLTAMWMVVNCKNGVSSYEIHRTLGVTQKSAWFMLQRCRLALQDETTTKLGYTGGPVEIDETFVGGKLNNMHKSKRKELRETRNALYETGHMNKTIVMGFLDRKDRRVQKSIARSSKRLGPSLAYLQDGDEPRREPITETTYSNVAELTDPKYSAYGSVVGKLEAISVHRGNEFRVWDKNTGRPVRCLFSSQREAEVKDKLRSTVLVAGVVQFNSAGLPISLEMEELENYTAKDLPSIAQMSGLIEDFTGGRTLKQYLEDMADE